MRYYIFLIVLCLQTSISNCQYFHESLDLHNNFRASLAEDQKVKIGFKTYSNVHFENSVPNTLDNFQFISRFQFIKSSNWFVKNAEFGAVITSFLSGAYDIPDHFRNPPIYIKVNNDGNSNVISPGLQYIRNWKLRDTIESRFQAGLALRYNYVGNTKIFSESFPFGYDFFFQLNKKFFSLQFEHSANTIYTSFAFRIDDVNAILESDRSKVSIPGEFENLTFLTISLGNPYYQIPSENDKLMHYIYFTMRRLFPSNKDLRPKLSFKYLDYLFGFNLKFKRFVMNPEYSTKRTDTEYHSLKGECYSFLLGYETRKISLKLGYAHVVYYELSTDRLSLENNDNLKLDKLIFAVNYSFQ